MPYEAIVYNVMIASPSDVEEERRTISDVIIKWNYTHSMNSGKVLIPLRWETHSAPLLGSRTQEIVNEMVLKHADVLVGIFKDRLGSPTGKEASGTIEEINVHHSLGKPVLLYFGEPTWSKEQIASVNAYKEECKNKGLIWEYKDCHALKELFTDHLQLVINGLTDVKQKTRSLEIRPIRIPGESLAIVDGDVSAIDEKTKILLIEMVQDPKGQICVSKYFGQQVVIETNNGKYFGFEEALIKLERSSWIRKADDEGRIFSLTELGYQEAAKFKTVEE